LIGGNLANAGLTIGLGKIGYLTGAKQFRFRPSIEGHRGVELPVVGRQERGLGWRRSRWQTIAVKSASRRPSSSSAGMKPVALSRQFGCDCRSTAIT
jgi:hypothetical protein